MLLRDVMATITPNPGFEGILTNDDNILAVRVGVGDDVGDYAVVQGAIAGVDAQLNPQTQDKTYLRAGQSTSKVGTQRTFKCTGDRYVGDEFQDFALGHSVKYGVGQAVITDYVWFCMLTGQGEKGQVSVIVNSDGSGAAGEAAGIDIELRKAGAAPVEFEYTA